MYSGCGMGVCFCKSPQKKQMQAVTAAITDRFVDLFLIGFSLSYQDLFPKKG
jgi:hypothetical protein